MCTLVVGAHSAERSPRKVVYTFGRVTPRSRLGSWLIDRSRPAEARPDPVSGTPKCTLELDLCQGL